MTKQLKIDIDNPYQGYSFEQRREALANWLYEKRVTARYKEGKIPSQAVFAKRMGLAQGTYSSYENGLRLPGTENLHKIAGHFRSIAPYLICGEPPRLPDDMLVYRFVNAAAELDTGALKRLVVQAEEAADMAKQARATPGGLEDNGT
jgi:transcriptional regulator with XRE-family HTH domain